MRTQQYKRDKDVVRRVRPKKGISQFVRGKVRTFNAHVREFEDDTASSTVVRWLVVVLLLHLIIIGGASLHGFFVRNNNNSQADLPIAANPVNTPAAPVANTANNGIVVENQGDPIPVAQLVENTDPAPAPVEPVVRQQPVAPAATTVKPGTARHYVASGDTWERIAMDNNCTVADLKALNPGAKIISGTSLVLPMSPEDENIPLAEPVLDETEGQVYVIKKGDTLSKIARNYKVTVKALQTHNNITDPRKIKIGQEIRIPGSAQ